MANETNKKCICCRCCLHAMLMQYGKHDPVLAECLKQPNLDDERFPYQVEVAGVPRKCAMHTYQAEAEKTIQKRVKVNRWTGHVRNDWRSEEAA